MPLHRADPWVARVAGRRIAAGLRNAAGAGQRAFSGRCRFRPAWSSPCGRARSG